MKAKTLKNTFAVMLSILMLSQGLLGLSGKYLEGKSHILSDLISSIQLVVFDHAQNDQGLPVNNLGDFDAGKKEIEEEKENVYFRHFDHPGGHHYFPISNRSTSFNDSFSTSDPIEVIVPPPDYFA